jgi:RHH-type proline utilization regulon transcriptional repressor/proline dehydrogenase/delta 1-pyrroline-5-carboxylate dehydrogenase
MTRTLEKHRQRIREAYLADELHIVTDLLASFSLSKGDRQIISSNAANLVRRVRTESTPSMMEKFLAQYGLTTTEGVALMCLAEALLRVPDSATIDALIEDKIVSGNWQEHLGQSSSSLVNSSTWALLITGKLLESNDREGLAVTLRSLFKRLGEPVVRKAVGQAMKELGHQFVLGRTINEATKRGAKWRKKGYTYSFDMLGEAARTDADALRYQQAYRDAIEELATSCTSDDIRINPGISVKLSALHARYESPQRQRILHELVPRALSLALQAKSANMGFNIDAEEADRLDLSLDVIDAILSDKRLEGWDGFGVVVQAYGPRARHVIDWLYARAQELDRKIMVRLVKGAYWDAEIKRAQTLGLNGFPVFTRKVNSDLSYLCCAEKLLGMTDRIYPQFATHNAHSVAAVQYMAKKNKVASYEFQRLHGMGEALYDTVMQAAGRHCRIYAPVGAHRDLLAYLVRRLLENGANSSFVNQIVDERISPEVIAKDPVEQLAHLNTRFSSSRIAKPAEIFGEQRLNARGWDITDPMAMEEIERQRGLFKTKQWIAKPILAVDTDGSTSAAKAMHNPADPSDLVGQVHEATPQEIELAIHNAERGWREWSQVPAFKRAECLRRIAILYEENAAELFALTCREAGKTLGDAISEVREAVDFARYYANQAETLTDASPRGIITCISPWNFPLAIFSGQILACLAAGNSVLAKPADQTPLTAARAVELMHEAGIPRHALQLLPGSGVAVGAPLTSDARISGVCFTGSTVTAHRINRAMAEHMTPSAPLVAETGGLNAMIVDSTALPEQVVRDVLASAFQSAGQRCSALRILYLQEEIAESLLKMLFGAMDELCVGNPWRLHTDIGPVIDPAAKAKIEAHVASYAAQGRLLKQLDVPETGSYTNPCVLNVSGIEDVEEEIFGPVLHVATFSAQDLDQVLNDINAKGYGLTFGLHTRMDNRVEQVVNKIAVGNLYVNRNQIGAVVGCQPFGGEGLSGTGPKAGGPHYVKRFVQPVSPPLSDTTGVNCETVDNAQVQSIIDQVEPGDWAESGDRLVKVETLFDTQIPSFTMLTGNVLEMPGPTGELNLLSQVERGVVLCLGPDLESACHQAAAALVQGNSVVMIAPDIDILLQAARKHQIPLFGVSGSLSAQSAQVLQGFAALCCNGDEQQLRAVRQALAQRDGPIIPLITEWDQADRFVIERHLCIDTTAAGGNASLIAASE